MTTQSTTLTIRMKVTQNSCFGPTIPSWKSDIQDFSKKKKFWKFI